MADKNALKSIRKTDDSLVVGNYIVLFGGEDLDGEHFTQNTIFESSYTKTGRLLVDWEHGADGDADSPGRDDVLGYVDWSTAKSDNRGLWVERVLSRRNKYLEYLEELINAGMVGTSSEAVHTHIMKTADGEIQKWPLKRDALTVTPAEPRMLSENLLAAVKALNLIEDDNEPEQAEQPESEETLVPPANVQAVNKKPEPEEKEEIVMTDEVKDPQEVKSEPVDVAAIAQAAAKEAATVAVKAYQDEIASKTVVNDPGVAGKGVNIAKFSDAWKYDNLAPEDHAFMAQVLQTSKQGLSESCRKALAIKALESDEPRYGETKNAMKSVGMPMKANELNQSTLADYGDEWVGVMYSRQLWDSIRFNTPIIGNIPTVEVPQGSESIIIPLASTPPTFYKVAQASAQAANPGEITRTVTTSKMGTANQTLPVSKVGAATYYTGEMVEGSLIPWAAELRRAIELEGQQVLEAMVIDGDTETGATTNINDIGGTPAGSEYWLSFNGFRKLALVTNTANSRDGGALSVEDFLETMKLMGLAGKNVMDKTKAAFILDAWTHWKALELPEVKTKDVFNGATIENGILTGIWGYPVYATGNMHRSNQDTTYGLKANSAGKVDLDTAANNTTGAMLAVRWDQWRMGWKRRITFESVRVPSADAYELTALMRVGLINRDTEASAITYNITL